MTITVATRADVRAMKLRRFMSISVEIVTAMPNMPGNLGVRITNTGLAWFTLTAWSDAAALDRFMLSDLHRRAMSETARLTRGTAFARIDTDAPFDDIPWDLVKAELAVQRTSRPLDT
jgi:quinol monooxygenase YgiN